MNISERIAMTLLCGGLLIVVGSLISLAAFDIGNAGGLFGACAGLLGLAILVCNVIASVWRE